MSYTFTETLTIEVPRVERQVSAFSEREYNKDHGLIVELAAIHEGMTANFNFYPAKALEAALGTWVSPYPKPIIMNHDPLSEPVGRVMAAKMEQESDGTPYTLLQVAITDPEAIAKVLDQRYLTGSVGGAATEANCSVCGADWAEASRFNIPCKHQRGKTYKGKLAYMEMNGISFKEYSFVNMPADQRSKIRSVGLKATEAEEPEGWVRSARVFSLDMNNEEILEFSESENQDVLAGMKKKDATPIYMNLKGAFLSALAVAESERSEVEDANTADKESDVSNELINEEEDLLAVTEGLSSDLAAPAEETVAEETEEVTEEEVTEGEEETEVVEEATAEEATAEEAEVPAEEAETTEETTEETQEASAEEAEEVAEAETEEVAVEEAEEETTVAQADIVAGAIATETDLGEATKALESRVEELEAQNGSLLEENAKLKVALKRNLAERVVDMKIALGLLEAETREAELTEHVSRTAGSLADSLRDLSVMPKVREVAHEVPQVEEKSVVVDSDEPVVTEGELANESDDEPALEDIFVDAFMGRRSL